MKLTSLTVRYARKVNLGNFQTADGEIVLGCTLEEGDVPDEVLHKLWLMSRANVFYALGPATGNNADLYLGYPREGGKDANNKREGADTGTVR
jgi:hypothetical protein